jgi:Zn finger protein HypA/HybF involved in hydrogenase expression
MTIYRSYTFEGGRLVSFRIVTEIPHDARKIGGMDVWGLKMTREKWIKFCLVENDYTFGTNVRTPEDFIEFKKKNNEIEACPKCGQDLIQVDEDKICPRCGWAPY